MKTLMVVGLLACCLLGVMAAPVAAQVISPTCLNIVEFEEIARFFALPTGGAQLVLTGQSLTFGDSFSGSGYVSGGQFVFTLASGLLPGLLEGAINLSTQQGAGSATFADDGEIVTLTYSIVACPPTQ
jgi:hypothetical protein